MKRIVATSVLLAAVLVVSPDVFAQGYTTDDNTATVSQSSISPGQTFTVSGGGFQPDSTVTAVIAGRELGTLTADETGFATGTFTLPADLAPGTYTIDLVGIDPSGAPRTVSTTITVPSSGTSPTDSSSGASLALTGATVGGLALLGVVLAGAGFVLVQFRRRRRGVV